MISNNTKIDILLQEKGLGVTNFVRYVHVIENEKQELFLTHKVSPLGRMRDEFYMGWCLDSETYWGAEFWDRDVIEIIAHSISDTTSIPISMEAVQLIDLFNSTTEKDILHLAFYTRLPDSRHFKHWSDWDDDEKWLPIDSALEFAPYQEDKRIIQSVKNGATNLLEGHYSLQTNFKRLHELMAAFAQLPTARVGQGYSPRKRGASSNGPNLDLEAQTHAFLEAHPFLNAFPNYVQFLKCYAGAAFYAPDGSIFIDIFGFVDTVTLTVTDEESPIIDQEGYYTFCTGSVTTKWGLEEREDYFAFSLDATGNRKQGIYEYVTRKDGPPYYFLCNQSFLSWLQDATSRRE
ncbi:MAG: hypothetical protein ACPGWR_31250 [Ardenticatenaceae bacterium]